jgi:hypothetical protein
MAPIRRDRRMSVADGNGMRREGDHASMSQTDIPVRGVPLRWRLGLTTSVIVTLVLGTSTYFVEKEGFERGREDREELLSQAAAPLAADIEAAQSLEAVQERLRSFQDAHLKRGYKRMHVLLKDASGRVASAPLFGPPEEPSPDALSAEIGIKTDLLPGGRGSLRIWQDGAEFRAATAQRFRLWLLSIAAAIVSILLSLYVANQLLIDRPLRRLLRGVRQMELGYWSGLEIPRGAWEMRWLAYRFRNLGSQLEETVARLVYAERRAMLGLGKARPAAPGEGPSAPPGDAAPTASDAEALFQRKLLRRYLLSRCRYLEARGPKDPGARPAARATWDQDVLEAERLGEIPLKSRLEDAAFRILEPEAFEDVNRRVSMLPATQKNWLAERAAELRKALVQAGVKHRKPLQHRVKHAAGIWRKMQSKGLALEQIHDLVAFRVIVPTEEDCYLALTALHERFEPLLLRFKDYVAEPKANGYRSLHTCVRSSDGVVFEVQIRTLEMHERAEGGDAAHWRYKAPADGPAGRGGLGGSLRRTG